MLYRHLAVKNAWYETTRAILLTVTALVESFPFQNSMSVTKSMRCPDDNVIKMKKLKTVAIFGALVELKSRQ